jgi:hypothetical protein
VKAVIRAIPPSAKWDAERMWVTVAHADAEWLEGPLASTPDDMAHLPRGSRIRLPRSHVIEIDFCDPSREMTIPDQPRRQYWERGFVDQGVLDGILAVHYIYRESPDEAQEGDKFPDSGWRIRGDYRGISDEELAARDAAFVALGAILNVDDTWLHLIDEPIGSAFEKDFEKGVFIRQK